MEVMSMLLLILCILGGAFGYMLTDLIIDAIDRHNTRKLAERIRDAKIAEDNRAAAEALRDATIAYKALRGNTPTQ
jgi:hypothetical protein